MPFSLKIAQDVFQTFEGCKGVVGIADEIVVFGKINEEHHRNMHAMLKRLQTFKGIANYMGPIIPNLRTLTAPGWEHFHTYLYGQSSTVYTDHKPLESIYLKQRLPSNSGRLGKESRIRVLFP